jgi:hypothetical protein
MSYTKIDKRSAVPFFKRLDHEGVLVSRLPQEAGIADAV